MPKATFIQVFDANLGPGAATVMCVRRRVRVPVLVCEACEHCVHASRTSDTSAWAVVCNAAEPS